MRALRRKQAPPTGRADARGESHEISYRCAALRDNFRLRVLAHDLQPDVGGAEKVIDDHCTHEWDCGSPGLGQISNTRRRGHEGIEGVAREIQFRLLILSDKPGEMKMTAAGKCRRHRD